LHCFLRGAEDGIKETGIICIFHQSGKGHKWKGAETERGIKERGIINFVSNRKEA
jgi:hypothetical protein